MGTTNSLAVAALLLAAAPARATDFTDYTWTLQCATLQPAQLVMDTCFTGSCDSAHASFVAPLPGSFTLDMHYEIEAAQKFIGLYISVDSSQSVFSFGGGGPWCANAPCSGDVMGIVIPVQAGNVVSFNLDSTEEGCLGNNGTRCTFSNVQFYPEVGIHPLGGGVAAGKLFDIQAPATSSTNQVDGLVGMGDVDGDGHDDWAYSAEQADASNGSAVVRMVSGADGSVLHDFTGSSLTNFGKSIANIGDVDGDGVSDLAVSEPSWPDSFNAVGRVHIYSGATKAMLFTLVGTVPKAPLESVGGPGDVDGDGLCDILVGATAATGPAGKWAGKVQLYSGATHAVIFEAYGDNSMDFLGSFPTGLGDVDGDGTPDFAAVATGYPAFTQSGLVRVWSGATGAVLYSFVGSSPTEPLERVGRAGDVDGDAHADIITGAPHSRHGALYNIGVARVRSGATGAVLFSRQGTAIEEYVGWDGTAAGDLNGDGLSDVLLSSPGWMDHGRVQVLAGPDGHELLQVAPDTDLIFLGNHLAGMTDVDADGHADILLAGQTVGFDGHVLVFSGVPGSSVPPVLAASGSLLPGSPLSIAIDGGPPDGNAVLVVGLSADPLPFKGGLLVPTPDLLVAVTLAADGSLDLSATWPAVLTSPLAIALQVWCVAPAAAQGFVGTDALLLAPP